MEEMMQQQYSGEEEYEGEEGDEEEFDGQEDTYEEGDYVDPQEDDYQPATQEMHEQLEEADQESLQHKFEEEDDPEFDQDYKLIKQIRKMLLDNLNRERVVYFLTILGRTSLLFTSTWCWTTSRKNTRTFWKETPMTPSNSHRFRKITNVRPTSK